MAGKPKSVSVVETNLSLKANEVGDQILLYDPRQDSFYALNFSAKLIWEHARESGKVSDLEILYNKFFGKIASGYGKDIIGAITKMISLGILSERGKSTPVGNIDVSLKPHAHPLAYEAPVVVTYTSDWMSKNHASAFLSVKFSDMWGPGCV